MTLLIGSSIVSVSCQSAAVIKTVESPVTVKGATRPLKEEHEALLAENIRLKTALKLCQEKP